MKIAQVCPYDMDRPGGVQQHIRDTATALTRLGAEVTIIGPRMAGQAPVEDRLQRVGVARQIRMGATGFEISLALGSEHRRLKQLMRRFDIVHYHTIWTPLLPLQAFRVSNAPAIVTFHDTPADTVTGRLMARLFRKLSPHLLRHFAAVLTPSEAPRGLHDATLAREMHIVPPCTDLTPFRSAAAKWAPYDDGRVNILFLGRLEPRKGAMSLLEAYRLLRCDSVLPRLLILGSGPEEQALRDYAQTHAIADVHFLGACPQADKPHWYATADIFCAPSLHGESFGIVLTEAMAAGKPVVAAANAGYRTVLTGPAARYLTRPGDPESLKQALASLVNDAPARAALGEWGQAESLQYDCAVVAPRLMEIYRRALNARSAT